MKVEELQLDTKQLGSRILIIGCCGAGKSTLAVKLGPLLQLPVVHLDREFWQPHWQQLSDGKFVEHVKQLISQPQWIMDGHYSGTLPMRLQACTSVVVLHFPMWQCLGRVIWRSVKGYGRTRPDLADNCPEHIDPSFWWYVAWTMPQHSIPNMYKHLEAIAGEKPVVILRSQAQLDRWLSGLRT